MPSTSVLSGGSARTAAGRAADSVQNPTAGSGLNLRGTPSPLVLAIILTS